MAEPEPAWGAPQPEAVASGRVARMFSPSTWSLRSRLLVGQLLLLTLACVGIGAATELALHQYLVNQLDIQLREAVHRSAVMSSAPPPPLPDGSRPIRRPGPGPDFLDAPAQPVGIIAAVVDYNGHVNAGMLTTYGERAALTRAAEHQVSAIEPYHDPVTIDVDGVGGYRLLASYNRLGQVIVTGLPLSQVDDTMIRVLLIFLIVSGAALVAVSTIGVVITRRALSPLNRVTATARQVVDLPLDRGEVELPVRVSEEDANPNTEVGQMGSALNRML
ncbi:MAG TPA: two-component sensor histidine kinase, partial [Mycobacterium sp.]|nr:two-component sensor histidine kinase [Mycobacterium sp.]